MQLHHDITKGNYSIGTSMVAQMHCIISKEIFNLGMLGIINELIVCLFYSFDGYAANKCIQFDFL